MSTEPYALVADPQSDLERRVRAEVLDTSPLLVRTATDGLAAHTLLAQHGPPALLVTNLSLPKRDGFALLRGLRKIDRARAVPAIAITAFPKMRELADLMKSELGPLVVHPAPLPKGVIARTLQRGLKTTSSRPPVLAFDEAEQARGRRIHESGILDDGEPDPRLQEMIAGVARDFRVPVALATVIVDDRQWFKSFYGLRGRLLAERGTPRDWSFCQHVVEGRAPLIVPDAREHPMFNEHPLVVDGSVTGYVGVPLSMSNGDVIGSLCLVDAQPIEIDATDLERLMRAAERVSAAVERQGASAQPHRPAI